MSVLSFVFLATMHSPLVAAGSFASPALFNDIPAMWPTQRFRGAFALILTHTVMAVADSDDVSAVAAWIYSVGPFFNPVQAVTWRAC